MVLLLHTTFGYQNPNSAACTPAWVLLEPGTEAKEGRELSVSRQEKPQNKPVRYHTYMHWK